MTGQTFSPESQEGRRPFCAGGFPPLQQFASPTGPVTLKPARQLLPAALVGAWRNASPADLKVIRWLARTDNDSDVERGVMELLDLPDSPLWSTGEYRGVVSRIDALFGIAKFVTGSDLDIFLSVAQSVLSEPDPALDLPEDKRWAAAVHGKVRVHSAALRRGIRETLVILSVHGDTLFRKRLGIDLKARVASLTQQVAHSPYDRQAAFTPGRSSGLRRGGPGHVSESHRSRSARTKANRLRPS